jgi:hypothetical protein
MPHNQNHSAARQRAGVLAVTVGLVLLTAACGGSPSSIGSGGSSTGSGRSSTSSGSSSQAGGPPQTGQLAFARCMRAHGVADFPDSGGPTQPSPGSDLDPANPTYRAARQACHSLQPTTYLPPAQAGRDQALALKFADCMRAHGITKYPDPQPGAGGNDLINLTGIRNLLNTPQFHAAAHACRRYQIPGGKEGP